MILISLKDVFTLLFVQKWYTQAPANTKKSPFLTQKILELGIACMKSS
jgi:hypothetical protein